MLMQHIYIFFRLIVTIKEERFAEVKLLRREKSILFIATIIYLRPNVTFLSFSAANKPPISQQEAPLRSIKIEIPNIRRIIIANYSPLIIAILITR